MLLTWRTRWGANVAGTRTRLHVRLPVGGRLGLGSWGDEPHERHAVVLGTDDGAALENLERRFAPEK